MSDRSATTVKFPRLKHRLHARLIAMAVMLCPPVAARAADPVAGRAAPAKFEITAFDVSGVSKLDADTVERTVYPFSGPDRTSKDVEAARKALQDAYAARGYEAVQVEIPPQPDALFGKGIVELRVTEAAVGQVRVTGSRYHALGVVREQVPSLAEGQPLNLKSLSGEIEAANRFPDRSVSPTFRAGKVPGTIDVDLKVEDKLPFHASVEVNNDHSPSTEPLRVIASARYSNLWQLGHTITGTYIVAPQDRHQTEVFSGSYSAPLLGTPWTLLLYGYSSNSNVAALGGVNVLGKGYQIGVRGIYRLPTKSFYQNVSFGFDYKNFDQNVSVGGKLAGTEPIEYIPLYASYAASRVTDSSSFDSTVSVTAGLRALKKVSCFQTDPTATCVPVDQFKNKDFDSNENFVHANIDLTYTRALKYDIVGFLRVYGQIADSHLITNEQFAIGGLSSVRGFLQSEAVGDDGYAVSAELRSPSIAPRLGAFVDEFRLYGFVEGGQVRVLHPLAEQTGGYSLLSAGGGARIRLLKTLSGELAVGVPLVDGPNTRAGDVRTTFSAKGEF